MNKTQKTLYIIGLIWRPVVWVVIIILLTINKNI